MEGQSLVLLPILVCCLCMHCCHGDPAVNFTVEENNRAEFPCKVNDTATTFWLLTTKHGGSSPETISQGTAVYPGYSAKFTLAVSDGPPDTSYNKIVTLSLKVAEEDEGLYLCQEAGEDKAQFILVVEIPPVLHLEMDNTIVNTSVDVDVVANQQVAIACIAERSKPPVRLSWMVNDEVKSGPFIEDSLSSSERKVTSILHYIPTVKDNTVTCVASGQQVIPEQKVTLSVNVQYEPNCFMGVFNATNAFVVTCLCKANPPVDRFEIYVNGSIFSRESKTTLPSDKSATVFCNATNGIGSSATEPQHLKAFHGDTAVNSTIKENSRAEFPCNVNNTATTIWLLTTKHGGSSPETISQGTTVYTTHKDKFKLAVSDGPPDMSYNKTVTLSLNAIEEDEGLYLCQEAGEDRAQFNLVVEIPPVLHLEMNNAVVNTTVDVVSNQQVAITCIAERSKPPVRLSWMVNDEVKSGPFIEDSSSERKVTSIIHYKLTVGDNTLTCVAGGQLVIPEQNITLAVNVQYEPNCVMAVSNTTNAFVITCSCNANPEVDGFEIYVNGTIFSRESKTTLPSEKSATVFCYATNEIGSSATEPQHLKPFHEEVPIQISKGSFVIWLTVGAIILIVLIVVAAVAVVKYRQKRKDAAEAEAAETKAKFELDINQEVAFMAGNRTLPPEDTSEEDTPLKEDSKDPEAAKHEVTNETVSPDESPTQEEGIPLTENNRAPPTQ